jgi:equilibrative nucleoside transporter 1/2/3
MYNVLDLIGRYVPLIKCLKITNRKVLMAAILARFLFIPAFYFTAKYGDQGYMIFLTSFLGLTNGYLTVCVLAEAPNGYKASLPSSLSMQISYFQRACLSRGAGHSLYRGFGWVWRLACMYAEHLFLLVQGPEQNALGNVLVVCLLAGIFSGVVLDWMWLIGKGW